MNTKKSDGFQLPEKSEIKSCSIKLDRSLRAKYYVKQGNEMKLRKYFSETAGIGVMSTADSEGSVNSAVYARPHFLEDGQVTFIMRDRLTRANLKSNPHANYMFIERSGGVNGLRLSLEKVSEERNDEKIAALSRRKGETADSSEDRYLVSFRVERILTLIGGNEITTH